MNLRTNSQVNFNRRSFIKMSSSVGLGLALGSSVVGKESSEKKARGSVLPSGLITPVKIDPLRIGVVGVGVRGSELIRNLLALSGCQVTAICDIENYKVVNNQRIVQQKGWPEPKGYSKGETDFKNLCQQEDVDLVIAATPIQWHVPICVEAMKNGKHSATEVHATYELDECWELVETCEKYNKQCCILENYCYIRNLMMFLKMARKGLLGELVFSEAGYHHDCRNVRFGSDGSLLWRAKDMLTHNGNLYPTHAIGPVAQWFNINRGDKFDYLVSMSSRSSGMNVFAKEHFGPDHPSAKQIYKQGDMSSTMICTAKGASFTLYFDAQLPRPFDMIYRVQGTKGIYMGWNDEIYIEGKSPNDEQWEPAKKYLPEYEHPLWATLSDKAKHFGHWGADYVMMYRLVEAFRRGELVDMDVYDAAVWSAISPLSEQSVANKSRPVDFPDFTRGKWETNKPLGIIEA